MSLGLISLWLDGTRRRCYARRGPRQSVPMACLPFLPTRLHVLLAHPTITTLPAI